jgi:hypothetical protein
LVLAYKGITYTTHKKVLDIGPLEVSKEQKHTVPYSPILGGLAVVGGIVIVALSGRKTA